MQPRLFSRSLAGSFLLAMSLTSASATVLVYRANLDGLSEAPPNASPATGTAQVTVDTVISTMRVQVSFSGLLGTTTAAHIHTPTAVPGAGTAGVATQTPSFIGFPSGVTSGTYDHTFDMTLASSYRAAFLNADPFFGNTALAFSALLNSFDNGTAYVNVHSTVFPGGEIRGFLKAAPDAGHALAWLAPALAGLAVIGRRSRIG